MILVAAAAVMFANPAWAQSTTITEDGAGTATTTPPNCQNVGGTCTTELQGTITGNLINNTDPTEGIVGTFTANYQPGNVTFPTPTTFSVPATGEATLTDADGSQLFISAEGTLSGSSTIPGAPLDFEGTFDVTGGTGRFTGANGSGDLDATMTGSPNGTFIASLDGTLVSDIDFNKRGSPASVNVGEEVTYTITVDNDGTDNIEGLEIEDLLQGADVEVQEVSTDRSEDDCFIVSNTEIECELGTLEGEGGDDVAEITIVVEALETGTIQNTATLLSEEGDEIAEEQVTTTVNNNGNNNNKNRRDRFPPGFFDKNPSIDDLEDAENDLNDLDDEITDAEASISEFEDDLADSEATTGDGDGRALAQSGDPDEQAPVSGPQGEVVDEIPTEGPLPNTPGISLIGMVLFGAIWTLGGAIVIYRLTRGRS